MRVQVGTDRVRLRRMSAADVAQVIEVQEPGAVLGLADVFPQDAHPFPRDDVARRWREEIEEPRIDCFVVLLDEVVVGFVALRGNELLHFGIAVEHWGSGVATAAHDAALVALRQAGHDRAWLRVFTDNGRGRRFYDKLGWRPTGDRTRSSFPPHPELLRYERALADHSDADS